MSKVKRDALAVARKRMLKYVRTMSVDEIESAIEFTEHERERFEHEMWEMEGVPQEVLALGLKRAQQEARIAREDYAAAVMDSDDDINGLVQ